MEKNDTYLLSIILLNKSITLINDTFQFSVAILFKNVAEKISWIFVNSLKERAVLCKQTDSERAR